jgi:hypothetical protein
MGMSEKINNCRVCGLEQGFAPWGPDGISGPTYEYCPCCGVEFGYGDETLESFRVFRTYWVNNQKKWYKNSKMPINWDWEEQMRHIPDDFL